MNENDCRGSSPRAIAYLSLDRARGGGRERERKGRQRAAESCRGQRTGASCQDKWGRARRDWDYLTCEMMMNDASFAASSVIGRTGRLIINNYY